VQAAAGDLALDRWGQLVLPAVWDETADDAQFLLTPQDGQADLNTPRFTIS